MCKNWNPNGTGEFHFFNTTITSAVYENGTVTENDPVVRSFLVSNLLQPPAKLVDVDPEAQTKSTIYGLTLSILSDPEVFPPTTFLEAEWTRSVIAYNTWVRLICGGGGDHMLSAQGTSKLKNVVWGDTSESIFLEQLRRANEMGQLSVRITLYQFSADYRSGNFSFGNVVGTIGISRSEEPLNAGGQRLLSYKGVPFPYITVPQTDSCYNATAQNEKIFWTYKAPFKVQEVGKHFWLSVDLSNALAMDAYGDIRNVGKLRFAIFVENLCCMDIIEAEIDYLADGWLKRTGGIVDINLHDEHFKRLNKSHLLLVRLMDSTGQNDDAYKVCECLPSRKNLPELIQVLLKEIRYFIRPMDYIVFRLQRTFNDSATINLLVTDFGAPAKDLSVNLSLQGTPFPSNGITQSNNIAKTNENGIATFILRVSDAPEDRIPYPRQGNENCVCNISESFANFTMDGQLYHFNYNVIGVTDTAVCNSESDYVNQAFNSQYVFCANWITVLAHSDPYEFNYTEPYTWVDHIQPIFEQYYRLYPVMSNILNMSNYSNVVLPHNINLLRFAMTRDFDDPTYMPVVRDLSPLKQQVVLQWLDNPMYNAEGDFPNETEPICYAQSNILHEVPTCPAIHGNQIVQSYPIGPSYSIYYDNLIPTQVSSNSQLSQQCQWQSDALSSNCTIESLKRHVQQAIELEFATIPLYMTSLYSIVDGCNSEVYSLIRNILMQEMLHMAQVANLLISLGGTPKIDSVDTAPCYPSVGLPGCVFPNLNLTLERASLEHIRNVFMAVEFPHEMTVDLNHTDVKNATIGHFYMQMSNCISQLTERGENLFSNASMSKQVQWPWNNNYGVLHIVNDSASAMNAIKEIIEQGEGTNPIDPEDEGNQLAHFYKFEEILCGAFLIINETHYSYSGEPIRFRQDGVWPMRNNPSKYGIPRGTHAYYETRAFHQVYRNLLGKLQETFSGEPGKIKDAVSLMESLQVHTKRVMSTKLNPASDETVGPVFDYLWVD